MACPLFLPTNPLPGALPVAAPLGDLHAGFCAADLDAVIDPAVLRHCCNRGYARVRCPRAATTEVDAVRFLIRSDQNGAVEVAWAQERDHYPFAVGSQIYSGDLAVSTRPLDRQIAAYVACYLRQKGGSPHLSGI